MGIHEIAETLEISHAEFLDYRFTDQIVGQRIYANLLKSLNKYQDKLHPVGKVSAHKCNKASERIEFPNGL